MRWALLSDVHANLPALEAVLADIAARPGIDATYHLGDLVGYAPWPNETVGLIRDAGVAGVAGNYDSTVAAGYKHCGCSYEDAEQERLSHESYAWTRAHVSDATRRQLGALPFRLDIRVGGAHLGGATMVLVHGTPTLNTVYWTADRSDEFATSMADVAGMRSGDLIAFGHTHVPWYRCIEGMHFVNTGSVGRPKDGDPRAGYAIVEFRDDAVRVELVRVEYDIERAAAGILASGLPAAFADHLRRGGSGNSARSRGGALRASASRNA